MRRFVLRYFVAPCTRLARFTVLPSAPYLNFRVDPVFPTCAGPVFTPMPRPIGSPRMDCQRSLISGRRASMSSAARQASLACEGWACGAPHMAMISSPM